MVDSVERTIDTIPLRPAAAGVLDHSSSFAVRPCPGTKLGGDYPQTIASQSPKFGPERCIQRNAVKVPNRVLVVTLYYPSMETSDSDSGSDSDSEDLVLLCSLSVLDWESGPDDLTRLRALGAEEVIVMQETASREEVEEVDWLVRWPVRYDLSASIHRDWLTMWCRRE
ncbi:hypothetical protein V8D89_002905 [Ganoderma adspersum]